MRALFCILLWGVPLVSACATGGGAGGSSGHPRKGLVEPTRDVAHPTCRTRDRLLAPATRGATAAVIGKSALGWAIVWSEHGGERSALRFLAVDAAGLPRSPSAEVVDRGESLQPRSVEQDGDGHLVSWVEGGKCYLRKLDGHGRPRGDVTSESCGGLGGAPSSTCVPGADGVRCKASRADLVLPEGAKVAVEKLGDAGDLVIASDAAGLHLYALDCSAR